MDTTARHLHAVTGAYGYSGKYIARHLLERGQAIVTLTNSRRRPHQFGDRVPARPLSFDRPEALVELLSDVRVLYNTYWVRFNHAKFTYADAVYNSKVLFEAAHDAGVERIVHVSITNPSLESPYEYFRGKAEVEQALKQSRVSHAILRPGVLFGREDILINNIAWMLRRFPVMGVFGNGDCRLAPIYVDDLAQIAIAAGQRRENETFDCLGPEMFTYLELVRTVSEIVGKPRKVIQVPPWLGFVMGWLVGKLVGDVLVTRDEINALMANLLYTTSKPLGTTGLTDWAKEHEDMLGVQYASELGRRLDRRKPY